MIGVNEFRDSHLEPIPMAWEINDCLNCRFPACDPMRCGKGKRSCRTRGVFISDQVIEHSINKVRHGVSIADIAKKIGVNRGTIMKRLNSPEWKERYQTARVEGAVMHRQRWLGKKRVL